MQLKRVPNRFFGIQDFPYLNLWIRDSGLKVRAGGAMPKITLGITGLHKILDRYHRTEEPYWIYWGRSLNCEKRKRLHKKTVQLPQEWFGTPAWPLFNCFGHQHGGGDLMWNATFYKLVTLFRDFGKAVFCWFLSSRFQQANVKRGITFSRSNRSNSFKKSELLKFLR